LGNIHYDTAADQWSCVYGEGAVASAYFHKTGFFI
jgi:hypothetical protein